MDRHPTCLLLRPPPAGQTCTFRFARFEDEGHDDQLARGHEGRPQPIPLSRQALHPILIAQNRRAQPCFAPHIPDDVAERAQCDRQIDQNRSPATIVEEEKGYT